VLEVVRNAGFDAQLGSARLLFNARNAIERYQALQALQTPQAGATSGPAAPPGA
jgi:hypothetical protein